MKIRDTLKKRGWTEKEIDKTLKIIREARKNKHPVIKFLDKIVYWIALVITIIGNFIISVALIPFLLTLNSFQLYLIIITVGIAFGLLFELLIRSITHLETKHHLFYGFIIPIIAIINVFLITNVANYFEKIFLIKNIYNPLIVSIVYAIAFILPYAIYHLFLKE